uniref:Uncharacterized protein n=1 Tax=Glossina austeni TaxID=7395 RepID=A0A1A9UZX9_GLOAU
MVISRPAPAAVSGAAVMPTTATTINNSSHHHTNNDKIAAISHPQPRVCAPIIANVDTTRTSMANDPASQHRKPKEARQQSTDEHSHQFVASKGLLENLKKQPSLHSLKIQGERASANADAADKYAEEFAKIIKEHDYLLDQIFNADETGLCWKDGFVPSARCTLNMC